MTRLVTLVALCLSWFPVGAQENRRDPEVPQAPYDLLDEPIIDRPLTLDASRRIPVQHDERFKPLDSLARHWVRVVTDKQRFKKTDALLIFLTWRFQPEIARYGRWIRLPGSDEAKALGYDPTDEIHSYVSWEELRTNEVFHEIRTAAFDKKPELRSALDQAAIALGGRFNIVAAAAGLDPDTGDVNGGSIAGYLPCLPPKADPQPGVVYVWDSPATMGRTGWPDETLKDMATRAMSWRHGFLNNDDAAFGRGATELVDGILALQPERDPQWPGIAKIEREVRLNVVNPFRHSRWTYFTAFLIGLLCLPLLPRVRFLWILPTTVLAACVVFHGWGIYERTVLSERAMIGTFYESLIFMTAACGLFGVAFDVWLKRGFFIVCGSLLACIGLWVAVGNPNFMQPEISKLQPVLINNDLIHIHVPTIMASYAALAVSSLLGHVWLCCYLFTSEKNPLMKTLMQYVFWIMPAGVIMLFCGIILGGVWADASWGRFWGWDPKEIGSLILWLVWMVIIHGRWAGWLRSFGTAMGALVGGFALIWSYYGTNFFWSGLHSYAGASADKSIPLWMSIYGIATLAFVLLTTLIWKLRQEPSNEGPDSPQGDIETSPTPAPPVDPT